MTRTRALRVVGTLFVVACAKSGEPGAASASASASVSVSASTSASASASASVAVAPPVLPWTAHVGRIDEHARLCLPRSASGVCKNTVIDSSLCELEGCRLVLSKRAQPPTECCFTPRFAFEGRTCAFAESTAGADAGTCGSTLERGGTVVTRLDAAETERVRRSLGEACCYTEDGDM